MSLVSVGDNVADYYHAKEKYYPGGSAYNVSVLSRRMGVKSAYLGTFGTDNSANFLIDFLKKEKVDISHITVKEGANAFSEVKTIAGKSEIVKVDKGVYKNFSLEEKDLKFIEGFDYLHTTLYSYTEKYLSLFQKFGLNVSFDYSFTRDKKYIRKTAPYVDIAFFSAEGEDKDKLKDLMSSIYKLGPQYVIFTLGKDGVIALYNEKFYNQKAPNVNIVDTLGAGDAFISKFLCSIIDKNFIKEDEIKNILKRSVNFASETCTHYGTVKLDK